MGEGRHTSLSPGNRSPLRALCGRAGYRRVSPQFTWPCTLTGGHPKACPRGLPEASSTEGTARQQHTLLSPTRLTCGPCLSKAPGLASRPPTVSSPPPVLAVRTFLVTLSSKDAWVSQGALPLQVRVPWPGGLTQAAAPCYALLPASFCLGRHKPEKSGRV